MNSQTTHPDSAAAVTPSGRIHEMIVSALEHMADEDAEHVHVAVVDHVAWLSGEVSSLEARRCAAVAARSAPGIDEVRNNIQVR